MIATPQARYSVLLQALASIPYETLFARCVLDGTCTGTVWQDDLENPSWTHIIHPYSMSLLMADPASVSLPGLRQHLAEIGSGQRDIFMQLSNQALAPSVDDILLASTLRPRAQRYARRHYRFKPQPDRTAPEPARTGNCRRMLAQDYDLMGFSVSPAQFWRDAVQFLDHGGGYCQEEEGAPVAIAFAAFRNRDKLEIGVETAAHARGKGYAFQVASALLYDCVQQELNPLWSCRSSNTASILLAEKLGFTLDFEGAYYCLPG